MKISPLDIYNQEFKKTTFGYNTNQVDEFLDEVGLAYERLLKEVNNLQDENERLKERLMTYEDMEEQLKRMIDTFQENIQEQTRQAKKEAETIIKQAETEAEQVKEKAQQEIQDELQTLQELKSNQKLFKIRFRTLLESHLQMLNDDWEKESLSDKEMTTGKFRLEE